MFYMDSPTETKQMRKENASSSNEYSVSRGDGAGDTGDPPLCETTVLKEINVDTGSTTPPISRLPLQNRTSAIYRADLTTVRDFFTHSFNRRLKSIVKIKSLKIKKEFL